MFPCLFRAVAVRAVVIALPILLIGCGQSTTEDRTIQYSGNGQTVAFQHGNEGVYVADKTGGGLSKVFQPDETILATSPPLHSPVDDRLIFLTARRPDGSPRANTPGLSDPPEGKTFHKEPVHYTCWLREAPAEENAPQPRQLFTARCDDVGYVAAGLGARWSPDGDSIMYVAELPEDLGRHTLHAFDLKTGTSRRVFPQKFDALVFDFSPRGSTLICAGCRSRENPVQLEIWSSSDRRYGAWHSVPVAGAFAVSESFSHLRALRDRLPVWTADESHLARAEHFPGPSADEPGSWLLQLRSNVDGEPTLIQESAHAFRDLHWSPDGRRLGYVETQEGESGLLRIYDTVGRVITPANDQAVRRFAGFDASGIRLAYVVADGAGLPANRVNWSLLLLAAPLARDRVLVADAGLEESARDVFSGMRVTFPKWSPVEGRLSLWLTFSPRYLSLFSLFRNWGLWRGDPAATLEVQTGEISWMAVSAAEELQIGHYHLLKRDYARAWEWYERASKSLPPRKPPQQIVEALEQFGAPDRPDVFQYLCLKKLGRNAEARQKLAEFDARFSTDLLRKAGDPTQRQVMESLLSQFGSNVNLILHLVRDLYIAEVFLSVDAIDDALEFFSVAAEPVESPEQQLSRAFALSQLLLADDDQAKYLAHCTSELVPLILKQWRPAAGDPNAEAQNSALSFFGSLALAPLFSTTFIATLEEADLAAGVDKWEVLRRQTGENRPLLAIDLFLQVAECRLGRDATAGAVAKRIASNPETSKAFPNGDWADEIEKLFQAVHGWPLLSGMR